MPQRKGPRSEIQTQYDQVKVSALSFDVSGTCNFISGSGLVNTITRTDVGTFSIALSQNHPQFLAGTANVSTGVASGHVAHVAPVGGATNVSSYKVIVEQSGSLSDAGSETTPRVNVVLWWRNTDRSL